MERFGLYRPIIGQLKASLGTHIKKRQPAQVTTTDDVKAIIGQLKASLGTHVKKRQPAQVTTTDDVKEKQPANSSVYRAGHIALGPTTTATATTVTATTATATTVT